MSDLLSLVHRPWFLETWIGLGVLACAAWRAPASVDVVVDVADVPAQLLPVLDAARRVVVASSSSSASSSASASTGLTLSNVAVHVPTRALLGAAALALLALPPDASLGRWWRIPVTRFRSAARELPAEHASWEEVTRPCGPATGERYVVVGAAGFVGKRIVHALLLRGETRVEAVDLSEPGLAAIRREYPGVATHRVDVADEAALRELLRGADVVYAPFANIRFWESLDKHYARSARVNVAGAKALVAACQAAGVKRLVATSTGHVTMTRPAVAEDVATEDTPRATPETALSHYVRSKAEAEVVYLGANGVNGLATGVVRPCSNIFGFQDKIWLDPYLERGQAFSTDPETLSNFVHVDSVVLGHLLLEARLRNGPGDEAAGEAFNVTGGPALRDGVFCAIVEEEAKRVLGRDLPLSRLPTRAMGIAVLFLDLGHWLYSGELTRVVGPDVGRLSSVTMCAATAKHVSSDDKARRVLGYRVHMSTREAVRRSFREYKEGRVVMD